MNKAERISKRILDSIILAGVIILLIGLYYVLLKAGIPYQDPPLELQIKYAVDMGVGRELAKDGFWLVVFGGAARILFGLIRRRKDKPDHEKSE